MKTPLLVTFSAIGALLASGCATEGLCERVECGEGGDGTATSTTTAQGSPTTSTTDTTSTNTGAGGDGGSSVSTSTNVGPGGSGGAGSTGTGGAPPGCELVDGQAITGNDCAIFVNADAPAGEENGTRALPYKTLAQAVLAVGNTGKAIYVCDATDPYAEAVTIDSPMSLVGGFGCASWIWTEAGRTDWTAGADQIPLKLTDGANVAIANFAITAADADVSTPGGSSIAILAVGAAIELRRSDVTAGDGSDGKDEAQIDSVARAASGTKGENGCTMDSQGAGVEGGANTCGGSDRSGGLSGQGSAANSGGFGSPGEPADATNVGGLRQTQLTSCTNGGDGTDGSGGTDGLGASATGELSASGFAPASGLVGMPGTPGSGGGGGGGAFKCENGLVGPSGGSGGAGGCGGSAGAPGGGGGASIAIALVDTSIVLDDVSIFVGAGGRGGNGAPGQVGQLGGGPGSAGDGDASAFACRGGPGGDGGNGGDGGGGRGGHALGIAWTGNGGVPDVGATVFAAPGQPGLGGDREDGSAEGRGDGGIADDVLEL